MAPTENAPLDPAALYARFRAQLAGIPAVGLTVDVSRMDLDDAWLAAQAGPVTRAYEEMAAIERGELVNTDERRRVGHYWLRDSRLAPERELGDAIEEARADVERFAEAVHAGRVAGAGGPFTDLVVVGIGGSSLGPRFVSAALAGAGDRLRARFVDNTDPDGIDAVFAAITGEGADRLGRTLVVVISKSGGTKETRNGMLEAAAKYRAADLDFARHAVAVTGHGSELDAHARREGWLATFPMWDWVGGRTSVTSAVGLLPAALQGVDVDALLDGARACDEATRTRSDAPLANPAMALALAWLKETNGRGEKDMVILPYKDRLALFSQYLQQLVMESLGKARDRSGRVVHQGIAVYGNKGSTDQHAYVQQLRDGVPNFFATFIGVLRDRDLPPPSIEVEPGVTSGDFLLGFLLGTRRALYENGRRSILITLEQVDARSVGALIALYERAVGFYAAFVGINAYHQPGVEAGKKAAQAVIELELRVLRALDEAKGPRTVDEVARAAGAAGDVEDVFHLLEHLSRNADRGVRRHAGETPFDARYERRG